MRLAHGWELEGAGSALAREFIRPAVRAVPPGIVRRLGRCLIAVEPELPELERGFHLARKRGTARGAPGGG